MARLRRMIYQKGAVGHIFQRARSGFVVFYSVKDSLVFFTIFSLTAAKHRIRVLGLCLMYNHIHVLVEAEDHKTIARFMQELCSKFSKTYNIRHGLKGSLLSTYGLSNKRGGKQARTSLAYLYNNPVEDRICKRAEDWRWNFLVYAESDHPYSDKLIPREASVSMRKALSGVKMLHAHGRPLSYEVLDDLFLSLNVSEKKQLIDFIVREYSVIDFKRVISYYGSYRNMLTAFSSNTGSEYDIREERHHNPDTSYGQMMNYVVRYDYVTRAKDVILLPIKEKNVLMRILVRDTMADEWQALKFLGMDLPSR